MSTRLVLSVAAGVVLGGVVLCGLGGVFLRQSSAVAADEARANQQRKHLVDNAENIGLAVSMWCEDHDNYLPAKAKFRSEIGPYLKTITRHLPRNLAAEHEEALAKFRYKAQAQKLTDAQRPEVTVLGSIPGEGGEAVLFYNGKSEWQSSR